MNKNIWFALVRVEPVNGNTDLGNAIGAFVNVAYRAHSKKNFLDIVKESFTFYNFKVIDIEDVERGDKLSIVNPESAEKLILLKQILDGDDVSWGMFYRYLAYE